MSIRSKVFLGTGKFTFLIKSEMIRHVFLRKVTFYLTSSFKNRMTPVAPGNTRILEEDVVLSGYLVPAKV